MSDLVLYTSNDGLTRLDLRIDDTIWLSQALMGELFEKDVRTINEHLVNIFDEGELRREATIRKFRIVRTEGKREVAREIEHYNLEAILAVGFRVKSARGTQFRRWANTRLRELIVKGFVMDDERLKNPGGWDYFDELLARIRDIRASEKRFYQKVRDLFALSSDYQGSEKETQLFFAEVQNKLLYAATRKTAAELIVARADPNQPNMALTAWSGSRVRKQDIIVAKNYLTEDEKRRRPGGVLDGRSRATGARRVRSRGAASNQLDTLNRLVVIFLEQAELRAKQQQDLTLDFWRGSVDRMLSSNDQPLLAGPGAVSHEVMKSIAGERYEDFDAKRRQQEALDADAEDLKAIEELEKDLKRKGGKK